MVFLYEWVVPMFILEDILGLAREYYGKDTYSEDVLHTQYPEEARFVL